MPTSGCWPPRPTSPDWPCSGSAQPPKDGRWPPEQGRPGPSTGTAPRSKARPTPGDQHNRWPPRADPGQSAGGEISQASSPSRISLFDTSHLGAYETPIDKMLSLPPQRAILERVPDEGAEPRPDGP